MTDEATRPQTGSPAVGRPRADVVVDADGLLCPEPIVLLAEAMREARVGHLVEVSSTDPGILADAPAWARVTRHELVGHLSEGERHVFWIRKLHD